MLVHAAGSLRIEKKHSVERREERRGEPTEKKGGEVRGRVMQKRKYRRDVWA